MLVAIVAVGIQANILQHKTDELSESTWRAETQRNATLIESLPD
jgi:hypothetical protein